MAGEFESSPLQEQPPISIDRSKVAGVIVFISPRVLVDIPSSSPNNSEVSEPSRSKTLAPNLLYVAARRRIRHSYGRR